jgi:hypothetical protein
MTVYVSWLADAARSTGYRVVEVGGWRTRGHGAMRLVEGVVGHHTATPDSAAGDYPSLGIVTNGRADLAGPLCNLGLGRDGTIYVVAAGCAWHAGASAWAGFTDLNDEFLGIEAESAGTGGWTAAQLDAYPKLVGALLKYMGRGTDRYAGHKDVCVPHGRKPDPVGIDSGWMRTQAGKFITGGATAGGGSSSGGGTQFTPDGDEALMIETFPNGTKEITGWKLALDAEGQPEQNADGVATGRMIPIWETQEKVYTFVLPVGATSSVVSDSWISVKCAGGGAIERVRLMSIRNKAQYNMPDGGYPQDVTFTNVQSDKDRVSIKASDGQDSYSVIIKSAAPFSICIENKMRPVG